MSDAPPRLFHFSHDPAIERFVPHVPATNPDQPPAVWAIDEHHQSAYWFPRDCPRATVWPRDEHERIGFEASFDTTAPRVHFVERRWADRLNEPPLHRYEFDPEPFRTWPAAAGQWTSPTEVRPIAIEPVGDVRRRHADAGIDLRVVDDLWPWVDRIVDGPWEFSCIRLRYATPRTEQR